MTVTSDPTQFQAWATIPTAYAFQGDDYLGTYLEIAYKPYLWITEFVSGPPLFTTGADDVNFNTLTTDQKTAIAGGADIYHGLGGNDVVTLPNVANYNEDVGNGQTLGWTDTAASTFYTGSLAGDTYHVTGGDGDYFIVEGAGTESRYNQW